jgi:enoyl-CoA hydratase/carnithine racemase
MATNQLEARIVTDECGGVGWITFDNAEHLNAFTPEMMVDFHGAIDAFEANDAITVVVLRGAGDRAFSAGGDLKSDRIAQQRARPHRPEARLPITKPTIAMIHGVCIGWGLALAAESDLRLASVDARFGIPVARLGFAYPLDVMARVVALVGPSAAGMLAFTGDTIDAGEALRIGLVDQVVAKADLEGTVRALAERIAGRAPLSLRASKVTIRATSGGRPEEVERAEAMIAACRTSDDAVEGRMAFIEKRQPRFRGR